MDSRMKAPESRLQFKAGCALRCCLRDSGASFGSCLTQRLVRPRSRWPECCPNAQESETLASNLLSARHPLHCAHLEPSSYPSSTVQACGGLDN
jgi:hypothetical protein